MTNFSIKSRQVRMTAAMHHVTKLSRNIGSSHILGISRSTIYNRYKDKDRRQLPRITNF